MDEAMLLRLVEAAETAVELLKVCAISGGILCGYALWWAMVVGKSQREFH